LYSAVKRSSSSPACEDVSDEMSSSGGAVSSVAALGGAAAGGVVIVAFLSLHQSRPASWQSLRLSPDRLAHLPRTCRLRRQSVHARARPASLRWRSAAGSIRPLGTEPGPHPTPRQQKPAHQWP